MNHKKMLKAYNRTRPFFKRKYLCQAPFKVMRFAFGGIMQVCCLNNLEILGRYPDISVADAWQGQKAQKIRSAFTENKFSAGCFECEKQILQGNFANVKSVLYDFLPTRKKFPLLMEFMLANDCNLKCIMCSGDFSSAISHTEVCKTDYPMPYDSRFVKQIEAFIPHLKFASFIGGEPFLINLYNEIWDRMISINPKIKINVSTNGSILNDKIKNYLKRGRFEISISIDSVNRSTYEKIRVNADFEKVMANFNYFYNYCKENRRPLSIWVCPLTVNRYELPDIFEHFNKYDVPVFLNNVYHPHHLAIRYLEKPELVALKKEYADNRFSAVTNTQKGNLARFNAFIEEIDSWIATCNRMPPEAAQAMSVEVMEKHLSHIIQQYFSERHDLASGEKETAISGIMAKIMNLKKNMDNKQMLEDALNLIVKFDPPKIIEMLDTKSEAFIMNYLKTHMGNQQLSG